MARPELGGTSRASSDGRGEVPNRVDKLAISKRAALLIQDSLDEQSSLAAQHALRTSGTCHPNQGRARRSRRFAEPWNELSPTSNCYRRQGLLSSLPTTWNSFYTSNRIGLDLVEPERTRDIDSHDPFSKLATVASARSIPFSIV